MLILVDTLRRASAGRVTTIPTRAGEPPSTARRIASQVRACEPGTPVIASWTSDPRFAAAANPPPMATPFTAGSDCRAPDRRPSSFRSQ